MIHGCEILEFFLSLFLWIFMILSVLQTFCLLAVLFPLLISDLPLCSLSRTNTDRITEKRDIRNTSMSVRTVKSNNNEQPQGGATVTEIVCRPETSHKRCLNNDPLGNSSSLLNSDNAYKVLWCIFVGQNPETFYHSSILALSFTSSWSQWDFEWDLRSGGKRFYSTT